MTFDLKIPGEESPLESREDRAELLRLEDWREGGRGGGRG